MTDSYSLVVKKSAERELRAIPKTDLRRITERLRGLTSNPRPPGCEKLSGHDQFRIRQGDYRMVYAIDNDTGWSPAGRLLLRTVYGIRSIADLKSHTKTG